MMAGLIRPLLAFQKGVPTFFKSAIAIIETGNTQSALAELDRVSDEQIEQFLQHVIERLEWALHGDGEH